MGSISPSAIGFGFASTSCLYLHSDPLVVERFDLFFWGGKGLFLALGVEKLPRRLWTDGLAFLVWRKLSSPQGENLAVGLLNFGLVSRSMVPSSES